jgi:hypothetical protein
MLNEAARRRPNGVTETTDHQNPRDHESEGSCVFPLQEVSPLPES